MSDPAGTWSFWGVAVARGVQAQQTTQTAQLVQVFNGSQHDTDSTLRTHRGSWRATSTTLSHHIIPQNQVLIYFY